MGKEWEVFLNEISHDSYLSKIDLFMPSAWIGHAPIMKFVIREMQPSTFVELGVHNGFSYFVGCQAIAENSLATKAFAIDHWKGDSQAGYFDENVFATVQNRNLKYSHFSTLLKLDFSQALEKFAGKSIDLLHIDGFHSYKSVRNDFESWLPKMTSDGIVLLHDIHVRRNSFGVYKFWEEIKSTFSTIEFTGSHGLGVVYLGESKGGMSSLREIANHGNLAQVQGTFGSISDDIIQSSRNTEIANLRMQNANVIAERDGLVAERELIKRERDSIVNSTIWKITRPYRFVLEHLRKWIN
jgi:predicted O-methyltransferase YrrM